VVNRLADSLGSRSTLVYHLGSRHRALQLAAHAENLVGGNSGARQEQRALLEREGRRENHHRVEGMLRIEVALEVDGGASARGHHAMEEAQMRSTLHAALRPVQLARH